MLCRRRGDEARGGARFGADRLSTRGATAVRSGTVGGEGWRAGRPACPAQPGTSRGGAADLRKAEERLLRPEHDVAHFRPDGAGADQECRRTYQLRTRGVRPGAGPGPGPGDEDGTPQAVRVGQPRPGAGVLAGLRQSLDRRGPGRPGLSLYRRPCASLPWSHPRPAEDPRATAPAVYAGDDRLTGSTTPTGSRCCSSPHPPTRGCWR